MHPDSIRRRNSLCLRLWRMVLVPAPAPAVAAMVDGCVDNGEIWFLVIRGQCCLCSCVREKKARSSGMRKATRSHAMVSCSSLFAWSCSYQDYMYHTILSLTLHAIIPSRRFLALGDLWPCILFSSVCVVVRNRRDGKGIIVRIRSSTPSPRTGVESKRASPFEIASSVSFCRRVDSFPTHLCLTYGAPVLLSWDRRSNLNVHQQPFLFNGTTYCECFSRPWLAA